MHVTLSPKIHKKINHLHRKKNVASHQFINKWQINTRFSECNELKYFSVRQSCGRSTDRNNTYFVSPNFPSTNTGGGKCEFTIRRQNPNICQLRIDFKHFTLAQPNAWNGVCENDTLTVIGGTSSVPTLCGENKGQHSKSRWEIKPWQLIDFN